VSESSHPPAWPSQCTLKSRQPASSSASIKVASPQVDPIFLDRERAQAHTDSGRKYIYRLRPQASTHPHPHINDQGRKHKKNIAQGRKSQHPRTAAHRHARGKGVGKGEEGSNPPVHREREGEGAINTPYIHPIPTLL